MVGILLITFAVVRLRAPGLYEEMAASGQSAGERKADAKLANIRSYLGRFKRTGNDLPAVLNTRVWIEKDDVIENLWMLEKGEHATLPAGDRGRAEVELYLKGRAYVIPLLEVLEDETLTELHAPASEALTICAFTPTNIEDYAKEQERQRIVSRNQLLEKCAIEFINTQEDGYLCVDEQYQTKRQKLIEIIRNEESAFSYSTAGKIGATFSETGFVSIMGKLFSGTLYSHMKQQFVFAIIADRWFITFWLNIMAIILAWGIAVPLGIRAARKKGSLEERATGGALMLLWSTPEFFLGTILLVHLCTDSSYGQEIFPSKGLTSDDVWMSTPAFLWDICYHSFLPLIVLTYNSFTVLSRYMRGQLLGELSSDYVRTARAKGASEDQIVYGHSLRNSMVTMITLGSGLLASMYGGFIFVELIFNIQGLGTLLLDAALTADAPLIMGSTIVSVGLLLISILVADILYAVVDPRIRSQYV